MRKLELEPNEIVRRFLISSGFESKHTVVIAPSRHLSIKRLVFYPYTHGTTPWETFCDLSRFADTVVVTDFGDLRLVHKLAECSMRRYDHRLRLYTSNSSLPMILVSDREAIRDNILVPATEKEYEDAVAEAQAIIKASKLVEYGDYLDLDEVCRTYGC
jgi:hypothetical protein